MEITRTLVAGAMGLALVVGGVGCGQAAEKVADEAVEDAIEDAEQAAEENGACEDLDISSDGDVSGSCGGTDFEAAAGGDVNVETDEGQTDIGSGADVPEDWPADLEVVEGLDVLYSANDSGGLSYTGYLDGDLQTVSDGILADVEAAGFTITENVTEDEGDGRMGRNITGTDAEYEARIAITETPNQPKGDLTIAYYLEPQA